MSLCYFDIGNNGISLLKRCNNSTADRYPLLNRKSRCKYAVLIKFDIGIPMLARTMSHWYRLDAVPLSRRWNFMIWQVILIRIHNGTIKLGVTMQNTNICCYFDVCHEFPISTEGLNYKPVLIFSQILWILSIRLIERETDMRIYCSQWQLDDEL